MQKILEGLCPLHKNNKHKIKDCLGLAKEFQDKKLDDDTNDEARGRRPPRGNNNAFQDHDKVVATIFRDLTSIKSRREWKLAARWVLTVTTEDTAANPSYRPWSEVPITFSRADQ